MDDTDTAKAERYRAAGFDVKPATSYPGYTYWQAGYWYPLSAAPDVPPERRPAART